MKRLAKAGTLSPKIRAKADELTFNVPKKQWRAQVHALFDYVQNSIRYQRDPVGTERVAMPEYTMDTRQGDCDDKAVLLASLLRSIGHPARFVAVGPQSGFYSHVYVETLIANYWLPLDPTENHAMGWAPKGRSRLVKDL